MKRPTRLIFASYQSPTKHPQLRQQIPYTLNETVILGSNEKYGCQGMLSDDITRLAQHSCSPVYSFPLQRLGDVAQGTHETNRAVKSDGGNLSPGFVYEQYQSFRVKPNNYGNRPARSKSMDVVNKAVSAGRKYEIGGRPYK